MASPLTSNPSSIPNEEELASLASESHMFSPSLPYQNQTFIVSAEETSKEFPSSVLKWSPNEVPAKQNHQRANGGEDFTSVRLFPFSNAYTPPILHNLSSKSHAESEDSFTVTMMKPEFASAEETSKDLPSPALRWTPAELATKQHHQGGENFSSVGLFPFTNACTPPTLHNLSSKSYTESEDSFTVNMMKPEFVSAEESPKDLPSPALRWTLDELATKQHHQGGENFSSVGLFPFSNACTPPILHNLSSKSYAESEDSLTVNMMKPEFISAEETPKDLPSPALRWTSNEVAKKQHHQAGENFSSVGLFPFSNAYTPPILHNLSSKSYAESEDSLPVNMIKPEFMSKQGTPKDLPSTVLRWSPNKVLTKHHQQAIGGENITSTGLFPFSNASPPVLRNWSHKSHEEAEDESKEVKMSMTPEVDRGTTNGHGIFVTWEDLWVFGSDGKDDRAPILCGVNGHAKPGEIVAIMGPSGCGKSTLLNALAGRLPLHITQTGDILINGRKQSLSYGTSAYVTQDDVLMTTLTVREAVSYSAELQLPSSISKSSKMSRVDDIIKEMGLVDAMNVRIGSISGGQKRRVSICTEILSQPKLLFLDEPTSGLDSAASYHVVSRIADLARREGMTVVMVIHQPSREVFELFNELCLLAAGKTVFFGQADMANEFFALSGFPCPSLTNPSDHYLKIINKDFDKDVEEGPEAKPMTAAEATETLVKFYASSINSKLEMEQIAKIRQMGEGMVKKGSQASFLTQSVVLTRRSFVNMYRDLGYYWLRLAIYIALCLCIGTIYHDIGHSYGSIQARGSMLMFVAAFLTFMAIGGFPSFVEDMKIFGRERLNGHYGATAFTIGNTLSSTPYLALISIVPGAIAYYLVGLQRQFDHFVYFILVLFMCMMLVEGLMMIVASIVPNFLMGIITGAGIQGVMMLNGGFFRLPHDLPKPLWRYPMYYLAFHKYANQGFYKNEFIGLTFPSNPAGGSATISGEDILRDVWQVEMNHSKWVDLAVLCGMVVLYRILFLAIVKVVEKIKPVLKGLSAKVKAQPADAMVQPLP